jgi:hypothetical protein
MNNKTCTVHRVATTENHAPGKFVTRICTERSLVLELITPTVQQAEQLEIKDIDRPVIDSEFLFCYVYSGDTGACLMTRMLRFNKTDTNVDDRYLRLARINLKGFYPCSWMIKQYPHN